MIRLKQKSCIYILFNETKIYNRYKIYIYEQFYEYQSN